MRRKLEAKQAICLSEIIKTLQGASRHMHSTCDFQRILTVHYSTQITRVGSLLTSEPNPPQHRKLVSFPLQMQKGLRRQSNSS